jgi:hypothetical protein
MASEEITQLKTAIRREKAAPEILPYETELLTNLLEQVECQDSALKNASASTINE